MPDLEALYPELAAPDRLEGALRSALRTIGSASGVDAPSSTYAVITSVGRSCQVMLASNARLFGLDFWDRGVEYGHVWCDDLPALAESVHRFLDQRCSIEGLEGQRPPVTIEDAARAHEKGRLVDYVWSQYLTATTGTWMESRLKDVFTAASQTRFRALMPVLSHNRACFSTCTGYPYSADCPMIEVSPSGECSVLVPGDDQLVFSGSVAEAVANAEAALPAGIVAARDGTAEDPA